MNETIEDYAIRRCAVPEIYLLFSGRQVLRENKSSLNNLYWGTILGIGHFGTYC